MRATEWYKNGKNLSPNSWTGGRGVRILPTSANTAAVLVIFPRSANRIFCNFWATQWSGANTNFTPVLLVRRYTTILVLQLGL